MTVEVSGAIRVLATSKRALRKFMDRHIYRLVLCLAIFASPAWAQQDSLTKSFKLFKNVVPGVDFFASARSEVALLENPVKETRAKLANLLGKDLAPGAIFICSTSEQRDAATEARAFMLGYKWYLNPTTPDFSVKEMAKRMALMGDQIPVEARNRILNQTPEMKSAAEKRYVANTILGVAQAILVTTLAPDRDFHLSRLSDMARSPLPDWLDVGIVSYASSNAGINLAVLQDRADEAFPLEDVLSISQPFVAPTTSSNSGGVRAGGGSGNSGAPQGQGGTNNPGGGSTSGGTRAPGGQSGGGQGGFPQASGARSARGGQPMSKDQQDRNMFDAESTSFFAYFIDKFGVEKAKSVIQSAIEGKEIREILQQRDFGGEDWEKIETEWQDWIKTNKVGQQGSGAPDSAPSRPSGL
jgi:hypothetical protein